MNGRSEMQGGKHWILPEEVNANRFFCDSHWLEIWKNHFCSSTGPNRGNVALEGDFPGFSETGLESGTKVTPLLY
jgi:hypothetical protein